MTSTAKLSLKMLGVTMLLGSLALGMTGCGGEEKPSAPAKPTTTKKDKE